MTLTNEVISTLKNGPDSYAAELVELLAKDLNAMTKEKYNVVFNDFELFGIVGAFQALVRLAPGLSIPGDFVELIFQQQEHHIVMRQEQQRRVQSGVPNRRRLHRMKKRRDLHIEQQREWDLQKSMAEFHASLDIDPF